VFLAADLIVIGLRALTFVALFFAVGTWIFVALWERELSRGQAERMRNAARAAAVVALITTVVHHVLTPAYMAGSFGSTFDPSLEALLLQSSSGPANIARVVGLALLALSLDRATKLNTIGAGIGAALALASFTFGGHTSIHPLWFVLAPLLLVLLRVVQVIAVGGEWGGVVLMAAEHGPKGRRTFFASFAQLGSPAGLILSLIAFRAVTSMPHEEFIAWGWRLPFLVSAVLLVVGVLIRMGVNESPEFEREKLSKRTVELPIADCRSVPLVGRAGGVLHRREYDRHCRRVFHQHLHDLVHDAVRRRDEIADPRLPVCRRDHPVPHAAAGRVACRKDRRCALPEVDGPLRDDLALSHVHPRSERQHGVDDYRYRNSRRLHGEFLFGDRGFRQRRVSSACAVLGDFFVVSGLWSDCGWFDAARGDVACA